MKIVSPDDIPVDYKIDVHLKHEELLSFVKRYLYSGSIVTTAYWLFNLLVLSWAILTMTTNQLSSGKDLNYFCYGISCFFLVIPIHEGIHALGYKIAGAPQVEVRAQWRKLVFYAIAHRFVVGSKAFIWLAIAPFLCINICLIWVALTFSEAFQVGALGLLLFHSAGCAGDFALINYFYLNRNKQPLTWDDAAAGTSTFLLKTGENVA